MRTNSPKNLPGTVPASPGVSPRAPVRQRSEKFPGQQPQLLRRVSTLGQPRASALLLSSPSPITTDWKADPWAGDHTCYPDRDAVSKKQYISFRVLARPPRGGKVLVCGSWAALGSWDESYAMELILDDKVAPSSTESCWASLVVAAPDTADAWPLEYFYILREDDSWRDNPQSLWEAPQGTSARRVAKGPPAGCVLVLRDVYGEGLGENEQSTKPEKDKRAMPTLKTFLSEVLHSVLPARRAGQRERPYQFCTKDLLFTFLLYWPSKVKPGAPVPLLLFLHGYFTRETSDCVMPGVAQKALRQSPCHAGCPVLLSNFCVCSPLAPKDYYWMRKEPQSLGGGLSGAWKFEDEYRPSMSEALYELVQWLHSLLPVDPCRTYLTGNSMGGYGAWELARIYPSLFAALCITCGHYEPCSVERLARLVATLRKANLPLWIFHGREDDVCVFSEIDELFQLLRAEQADKTHLRLTTEGIVGHDAWSVGYSAVSGVFEWMLQHSQTGKDHLNSANAPCKTTLQERSRTARNQRANCFCFCRRRRETE